MKTIISLLIISSLIGSNNLIAQGKIEQSKRELKAGQSNTTTFRSYSAPGNSGSRTQSSYSSFDGEESFQAWIVGGVVQLFTIATYYSTVGSYNNEDHLHNRLTPYPYADKRFGNYTQLDSAAAKHSFRIDLENSYMLIDHNLMGNHFKARIRPFHYAYIQIDYYQLSEYNTKSGHHDNLALFNFNACYDRIRFNRFNLGWTLGINYVGNEVKKAGFSYGIQAEVFMPLKISLVGSVRFSSINGEPVNELELKARYHMGRWYATMGYEQLKIASPLYHFGTAGIGFTIF